MTTSDTSRESKASAGTIIAALVGLGVIAVMLLTPLKGWLNGIPNLWRIVYPLLTFFAGYLTIAAIVAREGWLPVVKWSLLLVATLSATIYTFGGPRILFPIGRVMAFVFIATELVSTVVLGFFGDRERVDGS